MKFCTIGPSLSPFRARSTFHSHAPCAPVSSIQSLHSLSSPFVSRCSVRLLTRAILQPQSVFCFRRPDHSKLSKWGRRVCLRKHFSFEPNPKDFLGRIEVGRKPVPARFGKFALECTSDSTQAEQGPKQKKDRIPRLRWENRLVLSGEEDRQLALFIQKHFSGYHRLSNQELLDVEKKLKSSGLPATSTQAVCMRNYLYLNATLLNGHLIPDYVSSREHGYTGAPGDIKRISEALQVPPLQVLRCVVRNRFRLTETYAVRFVEAFIKQYDKAAVEKEASANEGAAADSAEAPSNADKSASKGQGSPGGRQPEPCKEQGRANTVWIKTSRKRKGCKQRAYSVTEADWREFCWAAENDMQGERKTKVLKDATVAEENLVRALRGMGLSVWTEDDIRDANSRMRDRGMDAKGLQNVSTPDIVFRQRVRIKGQLTRWLDIKNFYLPRSAGRASMERVEQMRTQALKYNKDWGRGAFVFKSGFCDELPKELEGLAGVLDGSFLIPPEESGLGDEGRS